MQKLLIIIWVCICCAACNKTEAVKPYAYLSIKFIEDEEYVLMERIESIWEPDKKQAHLTAYGFKNERLTIDLPDLKQTGKYPDLNINNICYNDGVDFVPVRLESGFLDITLMDSSQIGGTFRVTLEDQFNGIEHRTIIGDFIIYVR